MIRLFPKGQGPDLRLKRRCKRCGHAHKAVCNRGEICGAMISGTAFGAQLCACTNKAKVKSQERKDA